MTLETKFNLGDLVWKIHSIRKAWQIDRPMVIGQIRLIVGHDPEERYMCNETGLGSGTLHSVEDLFNTGVLAVTECGRRNAD